MGNLYYYKDKEITISISLYFEEGDLVIDGYDIGPRVKAFWGDSDYEYMIRIRNDKLPRLCYALGIDVCSEENIATAIIQRFSGNECYSKFSDFLLQNNVPSEGWTYR